MNPLHPPNASATSTTSSSKIRKFVHTFDSAQQNSFPKQPAHIQQKLFSVGMRVRKAMADGYKTKIYMDPVDDNVKSSVADQDGMARTMLRKDRTEHSMTGQTTMLQFVTATSTARKRGLELEQEELRPEVFSGEGIDMNMVEEKPLRNILQAKSRKKKSEKRTDEQNKGSVPMDLDDFGEADFLVPVDEDEEGMRF